MKLVLLTFFAAVYYGAWWLFKHGQEVWAYCIFVPCTFLLFPLLWAALINGPAGTAPPDHSAGDRAINNVLVPAVGLTDSGAAARKGAASMGVAPFSRSAASTHGAPRNPGDEHQHPGMVGAVVGRIDPEVLGEPTVSLG